MWSYALFHREAYSELKNSMNPLMLKEISYENGRIEEPLPYAVKAARVVSINFKLISSMPSCVDHVKTFFEITIRN